jgi:hypothetical protein
MKRKKILKLEKKYAPALDNSKSRGAYQFTPVRLYIDTWFVWLSPPTVLELQL